MISNRNFKASDLKMLRVAVSSFFDMITVAAKTILEFA
jgi:tRNA threonylcarbamoyladenosine modification (KEOPS) complex  Pcc1 subunit